MNYSRRRKELIESMIERAIREQVNSIGFNNPDWIEVLSKAREQIVNAGARITEDVGRMRRLQQLIKSKRG